MTDDYAAATPTIAVTMGDAAGIGPEIIVRALLEPELSRTCRAFVIGDALSSVLPPRRAARW